LQQRGARQARNSRLNLGRDAGSKPDLHLSAAPIVSRLAAIGLEAKLAVKRTRALVLGEDPERGLLVALSAQFGERRVE
jgi:hypothetical protein